MCGVQARERCRWRSAPPLVTIFRFAVLSPRAWVDGFSDMARRPTTFVEACGFGDGPRRGLAECYAYLGRWQPPGRSNFPRLRSLVGFVVAPARSSAGGSVGVSLGRRPTPVFIPVCPTDTNSAACALVRP